MSIRRIWLNPIGVGCVVATLCIVNISPAYSQQIQANTYQSFLELFELSQTNIESVAFTEAAQARLQQAKMRPNPQIGIGVENFAGNRSYRGFSNTETTFTISQDLELYGRRNARTNVASSFLQSANFQKEIRRIEFASNLAKLYGEAEAAQRNLELSQSQLDLAADDLRIVSILYEGGREPLLRKIQAETDLAKIRSDLTDCENIKNIALDNLRSYLNYSNEIRSINMMLLESIPKVSTEFDIERNPNYRALVAERNAYKFQIESARIEARPNASAYIGARNFNGDNSTAFVGGISVSVPIFNNNSGNISASSAEFQASEARLTNFALRTEGQRRVLINRINSISQRLSSIESAILSAEETYRMSKIGFQAGRINLIEVQTARTTLFELKQLTISNLLERVRAESDLAMIEGRIPYGASQ